MIVGVPRERKAGETRVALTPDGVASVLRRGSQVVIEEDAGVLSGYSNDDYQSAGATILETLEEVWGHAELLLKVKEPASEEYVLFRKGMAVFSFLHPAAQPVLVGQLLEHKVTALDFDLLSEESGRLPILEPMSAIAGRLAVQCGAFALQARTDANTHIPSRGILLSGTSGVAPADVLVIGVGVAGANAAELALGIGANVTVMDISADRMARFSRAPFSARTVHSSPRALRRELQRVDLVIGAVLVPGDVAPKLITREMLKDMRPGSVLVDI